MILTSKILILTPALRAGLMVFIYWHLPANAYLGKCDIQLEYSSMDIIENITKIGLWQAGLPVNEKNK